MNRVLLIVVLLFSSSNAGAIEKQQALNWCWASSVQDVIAQAGISKSQSEIASRLTGWPQDRPAYVDELIPLLRSYGLRAWRAGYPGTPQELYGTLTSGWKLIAFVRPSNGPTGHYIVLEGVDQSGRVIVADPATGFTRANSLQQLYRAWRWADSVVVGLQISEAESSPNQTSSQDNSLNATDSDTEKSSDDKEIPSGSEEKEKKASSKFSRELVDDIALWIKTLIDLSGSKFSELRGRQFYNETINNETTVSWYSKIHHLKECKGCCKIHHVTRKLPNKTITSDDFMCESSKIEVTSGRTMSHSLVKAFKDHIKGWDIKTDVALFHRTTFKAINSSTGKTFIVRWSIDEDRPNLSILSLELQVPGD